MTNEEPKKDETVEKPVNKNPKGKITLQNWAINHNISNLHLTGFKVELGMDLQDKMTDKQFCDAYKEYMNKPAFIKPKEG
jgi:hypothetical protein